jgi:hypothetical protein
MVRWLALGLAAIVVAAAVRYNTSAAGGSDSYCYVEQAERWASGTMTTPIAPGESFPWAHVALSLAPTGFIPSPIHEGAIAPICPAGLSLAMAVPLVAGLPRASVFYVVPLSAGLAVWCVFLMGRRLASEWTALLGAGVAATAPVFVFQAIQPMSDVPAAALWALALACAGRSHGAAFGSGLAAGAAVLVRPNLAPLAGIVGLYILLEGARAGAAGRAWRERWSAAIAFGVGVVPGVVGVASVNSVLYGSPLSSGYGSLDVLFSWAHVVQNLSRYPVWMATTVSPLVVVALAAPFAARDRGYAWALLAFAAGVVAVYLPYVPFDNWTYLRFLLPGLLPLFALAIAAIEGLLGRRADRTAGEGDRAGVASRERRRLVWQLAVPTLVAAAWCGFHAYRAGVLNVLAVVRDERRFIVTGRFAGDALPPDALVFTIWQSGSVRYYGNRLTVVWDALEPAELDPAIEALAARGRDAVLVLDAFEREMFRTRFAGASRYADLDWPPLARIGQSVTVWRFTDRARYDRGDRLDTLFVR